MAINSSRVAFFAKNMFMKNWIGQAGVIPSIQVATLRCTFGDKYPYSEPYPYEGKRFRMWHMFLDSTLPRLNENSKIITVEGNIGVGKNDFARRLAKEFDLMYLPSTPESKAWILTKDTGLTWYDVNGCLSQDAQLYDLKCLYSDHHPECGKIGRLQMLWFRWKLYDYAKALLHCLSTGQGVVMVRSMFSDEVMALALRNMGWISNPFFQYYKTTILNNILCDFLTPHLTIYLDAPADVCLERVKKRNDPREKGSNMNLKYLKAIESAYKTRWLDQQRLKQEVIEVDWTEIGKDMDIDVIADEISRLTLENTDPESPKLKEWRILDEDKAGWYRQVCSYDHYLDQYMCKPPPFESEEVYGTTDARIEQLKVIEQHPAYEYGKHAQKDLGYNPNWRFFN